MGKQNPGKMDDFYIITLAS